MEKHTPGPWEMSNRFDLRHNPCGIDITKDSDAMICRMPDGATLGGGNAFPSTLANARLIAAAPELLAVLKAVAAEVDGIDMSADLWESLHAAIARAEGKA